MADLIFIGNIVEENGKTVRQNNMEKKHNIPLGSLVEIICKDSEDDEPGEHRHGLRLFVTGHTRDCDGTPLYALAYTKTAYEEFEKVSNLLEIEKNDMERRLLHAHKLMLQGALINGYDEASLKIIS